VYDTILIIINYYSKMYKYILITKKCNSVELTRLLLDYVV